MNEGLLEFYQVSIAEWQKVIESFEEDNSEQEIILS